MTCYTVTTMEYMDSRSRLASSASRVLAIIGFVALIGIGMYGSVRVAQAVPGLFSQMGAAIVSISSIFVPADETITLSLPSYTVLNETPVTVAYDHRNKQSEGSYAFRYSCAEGVSMTAVVDGFSTPILCNAPFRFVPFNNSVTVTPVSTSTRFVDVEIFVAYTPEDAAASTVIGSTLMTIENQSLSTTPTTPTTPTAPAAPTKPTPTAPPQRETIVVPQGRASDPNGYTDLTARVIEVGYLDSTGAFFASSTPSRSLRTAVRFAVENVGTKTSVEFTFSTVLPTFPPYTYFSPAQVPLGPGDRIEYTIGFDGFEADGEGVVTINVDPTGRVNERNKDNNVVKYTVTVAK